VPLLERLRYLCIACTNLDEFFEVRVATVLTAMEFGAPLLPDRTPPEKGARRLHKQAGKLVEEQYRLWNDELRPAAERAGVRVLTRESWNAKQTRWLQKYFSNEVLPVLSPLGLGSRAPLPEDPQQEPQRGGGARGQGRVRAARAGMAIVRAPRSLPRIIQMPEEVSGGRHDFVFLSAVLDRLRRRPVPGMKVKGAYQFRVTRNSELFVDEEKSRTWPARSRASCSAAASARRCAWRSRRTARSRSSTRCCATSTCSQRRCTASTARSTSTA
jgi:polyphosphate kinase